MKKLLFTICLLAGVMLGGLQAYSAVIDKSSTLLSPVYYRSFNKGDTAGLTMTYVSSTSGINGQGFRVKGIRSAYSTSNVTTLLQGSNNFTVAFAVKLTQEPTLEYVRYFTYSQSGSGNFFIVGGDNTDGKRKVRVSFVDDGNSAQRHSNWSSVNLPLNKWVVVTAEKEGGIGRVYFDNVLVASSTFSTPAGANNNIKYQVDQVSLGGLAGVDSRSLTGNMDEVYVFNNNLTNTQKTILYNQIKGSIVDNSIYSNKGVIFRASFNGGNPLITSSSTLPLVAEGTAKYETGISGQATKGTGTNSWETASRQLLAGTQNFTVLGCIKIGTQINSTASIVNFPSGFLLDYTNSSNNLAVRFYQSDATIRNLVGIVPPRNKWGCFAFTKSGVNGVGYWNGLQSNSGTAAGDGTLANPSSSLLIGGRSGANYDFVGNLDEIEIRNYAMTATEVLNWYNSVKGTIQGRQSTLLFAETFYNEADATTNNITLYNTPTFDSNGIKFNGVNQYAEYNSTIAYPATGFTWAFDVKVISSDSSGRGIITGTTTAAFPSICMLSNKLLVYLQSARFKYSALTFENGKKYRVVVTTDGTVAGTNIYIDGVLSNGISSDTGANPSPWSSLRIGSRTTFYFNGYVKNVKLYNRILTSAEAIKASKSPYFSIDK